MRPSPDGSFESESPADAPFAGKWTKVDGRYYNVFSAPKRLPRFVYQYLTGELVGFLIAGVIYKLCDHPPYEVRVYWVSRRLFASWNRSYTATFPDMESANQAAKAIMDGLREGNPPPETL